MVKVFYGYTGGRCGLDIGRKSEVTGGERLVSKGGCHEKRDWK